MEDYDKLMVGDQSTDGRIIIADKDRLCYLVKSGSKGSFSIRTISKQLLGEFIDYYRKNPDKKAEDAKAYHAGLSAKERDDVQEAFINDGILVARDRFAKACPCFDVKKELDPYFDKGGGE